MLDDVVVRRGHPTRLTGPVKTSRGSYAAHSGSPSLQDWGTQRPRPLWLWGGFPLPLPSSWVNLLDWQIVPRALAGGWDKGPEWPVGVVQTASADTLSSGARGLERRAVPGLGLARPLEG